MENFYRYWVYGGFLAGLLLLALTPFVATAWGIVMAAVFVQLPVYMLHQGEEHFGDRFRLFVNEIMAGGREALTPFAVFVINIAGVWGFDLVAIYLAAYVSIGWGLIAVDLALVNTVAHVAGAIVKRRYNPGLITAVVLFLPVGGFGYALLATQRGTTMTHHVVSLLFAIAIHASIIGYMRMRLRRLEA